MDSPLLGLTLGMAVALVAYAAVLPLRPKAEGALLGSREALAFKLAAGILVGLSVWARWESLDSTDIAVVLALGLLSVPVVLVFSPLLAAGTSSGSPSPCGRGRRSSSAAHSS